MKTSKKIASLFLVVLFLTATVGITTYKHICASEGVFTSVLVPTNHDCSDHEHKTKEKTCCHKDEVKTDKKDCCKDEVKSYKVQSDYKTESQGFHLNTSFFILPLKWLFSILSNTTNSNYSNNKKLFSAFHTPPHLSGGIPYLQFLRTWRL
ncbi:MAG TPA: hypothetical protein PLP27_12905 [Crocinitomicaceae bacterium]|nr:hypothetical protein [Crocinitomicaceae bacterium]